MEKCKWCGKHYKAELFSGGFCSKKCEIEGGDRGVKRTSPLFGVIGIIIIIVIFFFAKSRNSETRNESKQNLTEENYTSPSENLNTGNSETNVSTESSKEQQETNSQNEFAQENLSSDITLVKESEEQIQPENNKDEIVIRLLSEGRSVKEVSEATGLSKQEVRKIRRNAE
ncbi:MAG: hypothetical protein CVU07_02240 [Bacteroidetes bacterium HGW-Bacteroidetes-23]|nr:MAG: hypothetical protein CVU07_02240 [Bacteroidetes bacterium HGW-Bacteroidetes-23]